MNDKIKDKAGLEERIRNTARLLEAFARENLDEADAKEVIDGLSGIASEENEDE